jgi:hypothetical protein
LEVKSRGGKGRRSKGQKLAVVEAVEVEAVGERDWKENRSRRRDVQADQGV